MYEIAVDVGGTFADFIVRDQQGRAFTTKVPSSHEDPLEPIIKGLSELAEQCRLSLKEFLGQTNKFVLGTTVGINALLEGQGAKTALITTEGFRDALELRRSRLAEQWDFRVALPQVLVPRHLRIGLRERMDSQGVSIKAVDHGQIEEIAQFLRQEEIESVAVCLLFACRNPAHEVEFKEALQALWSGVFVTLSSELSSQLGEYERTVTTVLNARLSPVLSNYLQDLRSLLCDKGLQVPISIAQNDGGLTDLIQASQSAVHTLFSGPAGGVKGGWALAREQGLPELVVADMGGTSFDVSLIRQSKMEMTPQAEIAGYPIQLPMLDIHTVGAGGGSIAWLDKGGMLRVGPHSAGAKPGPACYGLGGQEPTITDAALIMGLIDSSNFLGGRMTLQKKQAYEAIDIKIAQPLGLSVPEAAYAIYQIALSLMVDAVYLMTVKKGYDPRSFALAAVGGALPLFATTLAEGVGIRQVVVPELAPVFCAQGLHHARFQVEALRSVYGVLREIPSSSWNQVILELQSEVDQELSRLGVCPKQRKYVWSADLKYPDQHHEINIDFQRVAADPEVWQQLGTEFHKTHQKLYGYSQPEKSLLLVNLRLLALEREECLQTESDQVGIQVNTGNPFTCKTSKRIPKSNELTSVYLRGAFQEVDIFHWRDLYPGMCLQGPALIKKTFTTILLEENCQAELDQARNLRIKIGKDDDNYECQNE
ncbi:hydantoinase/oxoprolinase family protein [Desulfosporosinus sp.]|uniref:hydantoinase/oxoprolinase family protein n=1 Tax=Desulfosporosinus sp. TaxID=157907 RepID=UPI0025C5A699|nr:hydantoinase/oxoprolinase family protein [Desulfosporosinus sp.]MBC2723172.1 hydantoinase/oxoprolinase family protein [Desulfosporosinus sp.]MBC2726536.1 hydantoinase/oxoprolinase family protein [Desulfosporosinus sp.]